MAGTLEAATLLGVRILNLARVLDKDAADPPVGKALRVAARRAPKKRIDDLTAAELLRRLDDEMRSYTRG